MNGYKIGDRVRAKREIWEHASGDSPGGRLAAKGDLLIVRKFSSPTLDCPICVSHPERTDNSFGVQSSEIELANDVS